MTDIATLEKEYDKLNKDMFKKWYKKKGYCSCNKQNHTIEDCRKCFLRLFTPFEFKRKYKEKLNERN